MNREKFWSRVDIRSDDECWLWNGHKNHDGYGIYSSRRAHRIAYELTYGPIPAGMCILHQCDCPACVNPRHLRVGTQADNMAEKFLRRRHTDFSRKLTVSDVLRIRASGLRYAEVAEKWGISQSHSRNVLNGLKWGSLRA